MLLERQRVLNDLVVVLSQRPTLRRLLAEDDRVALTDFLDGFRAQSDIDWILVCDSLQTARASSGEPIDAALCNLDSDTGYRLSDDRPVLTARAMVAENGTDSVVAGRWIDVSFLETLVNASGLEQSVIDPIRRRRLIGTWPMSATDVPATDGAGKSWPTGAQRLHDSTGAQFDAAYTRLGQGAAPDLWLESALPISERLTAERRILVLLGSSTLLAALVLIGVAAATARSVSQPLTDALRHSQDAATAAQAERIAALEWLDALIQSIIEGVIMTDAQGVVRFWSTGAERILALPAAQATGAPLHQLLISADGSRFPEATLLANPDRTQFLELRTRSDATITVSVGATRVSRPASEGSLNAYIIRNVTEEEAHSRLRSYFLSSISHEFRTPLSTLIASLELLVSDENPLKPEEIRQVLRPAYLSVVGLQTLVDNLLTSSTIEAGYFALHLDDVDLGMILADAVRVVQPMLERRQQQLVVELPAIHSIVRGDAARLTQVLINLLANAAKYSPDRASIEATITRKRPVTVRVAVADEGPGVARSEREEIFHRFVRHHENEREQYGVGLGLYVAKTTIMAHGGCIGVDDRPGAGSIFWFELPVDD